MPYAFFRTKPSESGIISAWLTDPSVSPWIFIDDWNDYCRAVSVSPDYYLYSVYDGSDLVAHLAAENRNGTLSLSLMVDPKRQHRGVGQAVLRQMIAERETLFAGAERLEAVIYPGNEASRRCFTRCGFAEAGADEDGGTVYLLTL